MTLAYPLDDLRDRRPSAVLTEVVDRTGVRMTFRRGTEIFAQDDEVDHLYVLVSGAIRTTRIAADGRRQIGDFYYPGDLFGLEPGPLHQFSGEALSDCVVKISRRSAVAAAAGEAELERGMLDATRQELRRTQEHMLLLSRKTARERVAAFLMQIAHRDTTPATDLPMGRQDMADYLGLTIETVSRMLTQLQSEAIVEFEALRTFRVRRWQALENLAA